MTSSVLTLIAVTALVAWILAWAPVRNRRGGLHPVRVRNAVPFHRIPPEDADHARLLADLRALPDSPADVETRLRI